MTKKILALVLAVVLCMMLGACDYSDYKQAEELLTVGNYPAALEIYSALGDYKDAQSKAMLCQYGIANSYFESAEYEDALKIYLALDGFQDSQSKVMQCKYRIANQYFESAEYSAALEIYAELGKYEDAAEKAEFCEREVGMTENADYAFLEDIERSIAIRGEMVDKNESASVYLSAELAVVEKYYDADFYNSELKALARNYIDGLYEQKEALALKYSEYQIQWYTGVVTRYRALVDLYEKFNIFEDDVDFISTYVAQVENMEKTLAGIKAADADLTKQLDGITFGYKSSYQMTAPYINNTEYNFNIKFYFTFYDYNGVRVDESTEYFSNIHSGENCSLEFWCPSYWYSCEFFWEISNIS